MECERRRLDDGDEIESSLVEFDSIFFQINVLHSKKKCEILSAVSIKICKWYIDNKYNSYYYNNW